MWRCRSRPRCCSAPYSWATPSGQRSPRCSWQAAGERSRWPVARRCLGAEACSSGCCSRLQPGAGLSIAWSVAPDLSWVELNRTLVVRRVPRRRPPARRAARDACEARRRRADRGVRRRRGHGRSRARRSRRSSPTAAAPPGCATRSATGTRSRSPPTRCSCSRCSFAASARAGIGADGLRGAGVRGRRRSLSGGLTRRGRGRRTRHRGCGSGSAATASRRPLLALVAIVPAAAVAAWAFTRPALVDDGASHADRVADGAWFGLHPRRRRRRSSRSEPARSRDVRWLLARRRRVARLLRGFAFAVAFVTVVGLVANAGRIADEFRGEEVRNDPGRFASLSSNNRLAWWGEARDIFEADPLAGAGRTRSRWRGSATARSPRR